MSNTQFLLSASLNYPPSCFARKFLLTSHFMPQHHHDSVASRFSHRVRRLIFRSVFQEVRKLRLTQSLLLLSCHNHGFFVCYPLFSLNLFLPKLISWCISCWGCKRNYKRIFVCQRNWTTDCVGAKKVCFLSMRSSCLIRNKMTYLVSMIYVSLI